MAAKVCVPQVQLCALRVTSLNLNGTVVVGATTSYVTDATVKVTRKPVYEAGDELKEKNACGNTLVDYVSDPSYVRDDLDFDFLTNDPNLQGLFIPGGARLTAGEAVGYAAPPLGPVTGQVGVELWTKRITANNLDPDFPYAHHLFPFVKNLQEGDHEFSSSIGHLLLSGSGFENTNWFNGPADDWPAVGSNRTYQWIPTGTLPTADCAFDTVAS
jgi:hypothetical protein